MSSSRAKGLIHSIGEVLGANRSDSVVLFVVPVTVYAHKFTVNMAP